MRFTRTARVTALVCALAVLNGCAATPSGPAPAAAVSPGAGPSPTGEPAAPVVPLAEASDEFDDPATLGRWSTFEGDVEGPRPRVDIATTTAGALTVVAGRASWVDRRRGFYLYKQVEGDFSVTVRIRATGAASEAPAVDWSLTGLLVREPRAQATAENWIGYTIGYMQGLKLERKTTRSNRSYLRLVDVPGGWTELRVVRMSSLFLLLRRAPGQDWTLDAVYSRPELPSVVQVGINAGSGFESDTVDLVSTVDWIRFAPTTAPTDVVEDAIGRIARAQKIDHGYALSPGDTGIVRTALLAYAAA